VRIFHFRPLALALCLYAVFAVCAINLFGTAHLILFVISLCLLAGALLLFLLRRRIGRRGIVALLCLASIALSLGTSYIFFKIKYANVQELVGTPCTVEGYVKDRTSSHPGFSRLRVCVQGVNGEEQSFDAFLDCEYPTPLQIGDRFVVETVPRAFEKDEFFDEEEYSLAEGCLIVFQTGEHTDCQILDEKEKSLMVWASQWNLRLSNDLYQSTGGYGTGLLPRILLGNDTFLSEIDEMRFSYAGVSHLLALSGLHVSILIGFLELLLGRFRMPKIGRAILVPIAALFYLILTGCSVSAARAVLMVCILYFAYLWRGEYDSFTALTVALAVILQIMPYSVYDFSMWLSFAAAASIIVFMPLVQRALEAWREKTRLPGPLFRLLRGLITAISVGVIVNVALIFLNAIVFGELSVWSVPITLLFSIPVSVLLVLGILLLLFPSFPYLGELCRFIESRMLETVREVTDLGGGILPLWDWRCGFFIVLLTVAILAFAILPLRKKRWVLVVPILVLGVVVSSVWVPYAPEYSEWKTESLHSYFGTVSVYTREGHATVVSDTNGPVEFSYEIKYLINREMCTEIDSLILCKNSSQSTYSIAKLAERVRINRLHLPMPRSEKEAMIADRLRLEAVRYGIAVSFDAELCLAELSRDLTT